MKRFGRQLLRRCRVRELSCCLLLGFAGEAALTAKACGAFLLAGSTFGAMLRAKKPELTSQGFGHAKLQWLGIFPPAFLHDRRFHWAMYGSGVPRHI